MRYMKNTQILFYTGDTKYSRWQTCKINYLKNPAIQEQQVTRVPEMGIGEGVGIWLSTQVVYLVLIGPK